MEPTPKEEPSYLYEFSDFRLDIQNKRLFLIANNQLLKIQPMQLRLLCILVQSDGKELSNEELFKQLWPGTSLAPRGKSAIEKQTRTANLNRLQSQVKLLRKLIGKEVIPKTGRGYVFNVPIKVVKPPAPQPVIVVPYPKSDEWGETPSDVVSDFDFKDWLVESPECRKTKLFLGVGVSLSLVYSIAYLLREFIPLPVLEHVDLGVALCLIQFIVVGGVLIASYFILDRNVKEFPTSPEADAALMEIGGYTDTEKWNKAKAGAKSSLKEFSRYWKFLLAAWTGLYLLLMFTMHFKVKLADYKRLVAQGLEPLEDPTYLFLLFSIASTVFNNLNSLALALCFVVLNHPTFIREDQQETSIDRVIKLICWVGLSAIVIFTLVETLLVFSPPSPRFYWMTTVNYMWALDLISGLVGAITLSLCVGRIQSKFLGPSTSLPLALYLYVAIQSYYAAIPAEGWGPLVIEAALILKCLLYLYVAWLFKSGRLLFYLVRVKTIYQETNIEWHGFLTNLNR